MRVELINALRRLAQGDESAAEDIVNLVLPTVADPRYPQPELTTEGNECSE